MPTAQQLNSTCRQRRLSIRCMRKDESLLTSAPLQRSALSACPHLMVPRRSPAAAAPWSPVPHTVHPVTCMRRDLSVVSGTKAQDWAHEAKTLLPCRSGAAPAGFMASGSRRAAQSRKPVCDDAHVALRSVQASECGASSKWQQTVMLYSAWCVAGAHPRANFPSITAIIERLPGAAGCDGISFAT